jgi:hypothetical protein
LAYAHRFAGPRSAAFSWGIDASAMRLSAQDSLLLGAPGPTVDRRLALSVSRRF